jgi:hypothetical protein
MDITALPLLRLDRTKTICDSVVWSRFPMLLTAYSTGAFCIAARRHIQSQIFQIANPGSSSTQV